MIHASGRPFICRQCLARRLSSPRAPRPSETPKLIFVATYRKWASTQNVPPSGRINIPKAPSDKSSTADRERKVPIRERLQQWAAEQGQQHALTLPPDIFMYGTISNSLSRAESTGSSALDQLKPADSSSPDGVGGERDQEDSELAVAVDSREPGDLVELSQSGSRMPIFAVYLGFFGNRNHFYAVNGKWITSTGFTSLFAVSNFATPSELDAVLAKIRSGATPEDFDELRRLDSGPSREDGIVLINRMHDFLRKSELIYQANLAKLEGARTLLSNSRSIQYLSLFEIADALLPANLKGDDGFHATALYAVHTAVYRNEAGFVPLGPSTDCHRRDHLFEVFPQNFTSIIDGVAMMVREYTEASMKHSRPLYPAELEETTLGRFVLQAREVVSRNRQHREWTPHGILKPSSASDLPKVEWSPPSKDVITFLEWWASYNVFDAGSRYHSYGALILRALGLYQDVPLDQSTAWTFLQESGIIAPWEILSRYRVRFPHVTIDRGGGLVRDQPKDLEQSMRLDIAADARRRRSGATIFCIDAPSTVLIDDGVSLEYTDKADEYWIHVHAADPASAIAPNSELCKFMELIPENIYLPGHFQAMIPSELGEEDSKDYRSEGLTTRFSLRSGAPALTFSARVNEAGDILDQRIEPSVLDQVKYLDPKDVSLFCDEPPSPPFHGYHLSVGTPPAHGEVLPTRSITATGDLDTAEQNDLLTLYRLAEAIKQKRLLKGAWPYFFPRPTVSVAFNNDFPDGNSTEETTRLPADPYIEVGQGESNGCSVVANSMVLAGHIAARWCSARGIPVPYRRDVKTAQNFATAFDYATREIYPLIHKGIEPTPGQRQELFKLTGGIELSSQPGPYFLLGLDMYAKATSPLRRFSDLVVHWQIHAALAHERQLQRAMDPAVDDIGKILPFTSAKLANTLPLLQVRERMARAMARGSLDWVLIALVRAWRFEGTAPRTLKFSVGTRWRQGLVGRLDMFDLPAVLDIAGLDGLCLVKDVKVGDEFEVELVDVNVHSRQILVRATRYLGGGDIGGRQPSQTQPSA
ncbi:Exoribonuclease II [Purpureocillium takamizusanense]|uniref:Exoribonuclease II n=1 Tax=Purpureocillium takamizusanense TaxID=2060973 RepID=A0A9Q8QA44_9HYPO|nr:Exoribonuclease II [Purpureocillium takamizusanense]UNI15127.1 Exoribonuclease II [Purpureocillium takamizusanense]